jgi:hypothetical protein
VAEDELRFRIVADGAEEAREDIEALARQVGKIDGEKVSFKVSAKDDASKVVKDLLAKLKDLSAKDQRVILKAEASQFYSVISKAQRDLKNWRDLSDEEVELRTTVIGDAREGLDAIYKAMADLDGKTADIRVEARGVRETADDLDRTVRTAEGFQSAVPALRGFTDELGPLGQSAGIASQAVADLGDTALILGEKLGVSQSVAARIGQAFGGVAFAGVAVAGGVAIVSKAMDLLGRSSKKAAEEFSKAFEAVRGAGGDVAVARVESVTKALEELAAKGDLTEFRRNLVDAGLSLDEFFAMLGQEPSSDIERFLKDLSDQIAAYTEEAYRLGASPSIADQIAAEDLYKQADGLQSIVDTTRNLVPELRKGGEESRALDESLRSVVANSTATARNFRGLQEALVRVASTYDLVGTRAAAFSDAISAQGMNDAIDATQRYEAALDDLAAAVEANGEGLAFDTAEGRANIDAVQELADAMKGELVEALKDSGGSFEDVRRKAKDYERQLGLTLLAMGMNEDQARDYVRQLGLTPDQVETAIRLTGQEEARAKLQLLNLDLDAIDNREVAARIAAAVDRGDFVAAWNEANGYIQSRGAVKVKMSPDNAALVAEEQRLRNLRITVPVSYKPTVSSTGRTSGNIPSLTSQPVPVTAVPLPDGTLSPLRANQPSQVLQAVGLAPSGSTINFNVNVTAQPGVDRQAFARSIVEALREYVRSSAVPPEVQAAFRSRTL